MNQPRCLLIVDDNANDLELTLRSLQGQQLPHNVCVVSDGVEALDYLYCRGEFSTRVNANPTTVLLDLKMPRLDGFEILQRIKSDPNLKTIPVVVFTSSNQLADMHKCYELGANAFVVKPVDFRQFTERVQQIGTFWSVINEPPPVANDNADAPSTTAPGLAKTA